MQGEAERALRCRPAHSQADLISMQIRSTRRSPGPKRLATKNNDPAWEQFPLDWTAFNAIYCRRAAARRLRAHVD